MMGCVSVCVGVGMMGVDIGLYRGGICWGGGFDGVCLCVYV